MATVVKFTAPNEHGDVAVILTNKEFDDLYTLLNFSDQICSRDSIADEVKQRKSEYWELWKDLRNGR